MLPLSPQLAAEVTELAERYGAPRLVMSELDDDNFDPLLRADGRIGEVCMVIRRTSGRLLIFRKTFYPPGMLRLPTGGIGAGEAIYAALLREVAEETSLDVQVQRFLAAIGYRTAALPAGEASFYTFAFLLDEVGGTLAVQDEAEQVEEFHEVAPRELADLAAFLRALDDRTDQVIGGSWRSWGKFRAVVHEVVGTALTQLDGA